MCRDAGSEQDTLPAMNSVDLSNRSSQCSCASDPVNDLVQRFNVHRICAAYDPVVCRAA
jgi:hypothetical protein